MKDRLEKAADDEDWDFVDAHIGEVCDDEECLSKARREWFHSKIGNRRNLGVSIYEKTEDKKAFEKARSELKKLMTFDENPYVRFRSAFALFGHGYRTGAVVGVVKEAVKDEDVGEIAKNYLVNEIGRG